MEQHNKERSNCTQPGESWQFWAARKIEAFHVWKTIH
jgi:hypothetical protein